MGKNFVTDCPVMTFFFSFSQLSMVHGLDTYVITTFLSSQVLGVID